MRSMNSMGLGLLSAGIPVPPLGFYFRIDTDGAYLTDTDGAYLLEAI